MTRKLTETFVNNLRRLAQRAQTDFESARRKGVSAAKLNQLEVRWIRKSDRAWEAGHQLKAQKKNPGMFGPDAVAKAKRVTKIRRVRHRDTGQLGEITGSAPSGWVKVKWDNRDKATLIKRSEIALVRQMARGKRNPLNAQVATVRTREGKIKSVATSAGETDRQLLARVKGSHVIKRVVTGSHGVRNPETENQKAWRKGYEHGFRGLNSRPDYPKVGLAGSYAHGYASGEKRRKGKAQPRKNPGKFKVGDIVYLTMRYGTLYEWGNPFQVVEISGKGKQQRIKIQSQIQSSQVGWTDPQYLTRKHKRQTANPKREAKTSKDAFGVTHENPKRPTMIWAHTAHALPGGAKEEKARLSKIYFDAGKRIAKEGNFSSASSAFRILFSKKTWRYDKRVGFKRDDAEKAFMSGYRAKNPSVAAIAEKFQGKTDGAIEEFHAASSAPGNLARAGKLIFLKVGAKTFRLPTAMVAIAPNEKLWIVSKRAPVFSTKAKPGEGLDVGEITQICYETAKQHIGDGKRFEYVHEFGEDGGKRPHLIIDHEGMPILHGGDYKIKAEGIVN